MANEIHARNLNLDTLNSLTDTRIAKELGLKAQAAVWPLWDAGYQTFWRSTEHRATGSVNGKSKFFPTVTFRCAEALLDLFLNRPEWMSREAKTVLFECLPIVTGKQLNDFRSALDLDASAGRHNPFTIALYALSLAKGLKANALGVPIAPQTEHRLAIAVRLLKEICEASTAGVGEQPHPFVQFHALRAVISSLTYLDDDEQSKFYGLVPTLILSVRANIERLLAQHTLGRLAPSEAVALMFSAASLSLTEQDEDERYLLAALGVGFEAQDSSGCWPLGRVIQLEKDEEAANIEISTYEIAWVATCILSSIGIKRRRTLLTDKVASIVKRLEQAGQYAQASQMELPSDRAPRLGWCSDHPYGRPLIESWTSANVLQSMISLHELVEKVNRESVLSTFVTVDPSDEDWPPWLRWETYKVDGEPEDEYPILDYLDCAIVKPINSSSRGMPSPDEESVSILLFGPPGTSKTTLVKALADGLEWPVVMLSPGDFIKDGLEYIEAQARSVFDRLQILSRAVVLFDECDELFRNRHPSDDAEQMRGITAFVTASMLPKLQELHDRGKVVFVICTNKFDTLDPAVKRGGRIDHIIGVGPPQQRARLGIIESALRSKSVLTASAEVIEELALATDGLTRSEIRRACRIFQHLPAGTGTEDEAKRGARAAAERIKGSSIISATEYDSFKACKSAFSRPVAEGGSTHVR